MQIIVSCVAGLLFALFSGTPLIITGVTGPVLLYDEALFQVYLGNAADWELGKSESNSPSPSLSVQ